MGHRQLEDYEVVDSEGEPMPPASFIRSDEELGVAIFHVPFFDEDWLFTRPQPENDTAYRTLSEFDKPFVHWTNQQYGNEEQWKLLLATMADRFRTVGRNVVSLTFAHLDAGDILAHVVATAIRENLLPGLLQLFVVDCGITAAGSADLLAAVNQLMRATPRPQGADDFDPSFKRLVLMNNDLGNTGIGKSAETTVVQLGDLVSEMHGRTFSSKVSVAGSNLGADAVVFLMKKIAGHDQLPPGLSWLSDVDFSHNNVIVPMGTRNLVAPAFAALVGSGVRLESLGFNGNELMRRGMPLLEQQLAFGDAARLPTAFRNMQIERLYLRDAGSIGWVLYALAEALVTRFPHEDSPEDVNLLFVDVTLADATPPGDYTTEVMWKVRNFVDAMVEENDRMQRNLRERFSQPQQPLVWDVVATPSRADIIAERRAALDAIIIDYPGLFRDELGVANFPSRPATGDSTTVDFVDTDARMTRPSPPPVTLSLADTHRDFLAEQMSRAIDAWWAQHPAEVAPSSTAGAHARSLEDYLRLVFGMRTVA